MAKTFAERLDDSVRWTGIPRALDMFAAQDDRQRRPLRFLPVVPPALFVAGAVPLVLHGSAEAIYAPLLLGLSTLGASMVALFGPVKPWSSTTVDEFDLDLRTRAMLATYRATTLAAIALCFALAWFAAVRLPPARTTLALALSATLLVELVLCLPALWASWHLRPPHDDAG